MNGRLYTVSFENVAITAAQDLFMIAPATNKPVLLYGLTIDNVGGTADAGDAQEELLRVLIARGYATVGSGGSSFTPTPVHSVAGAAAGFTARTNDTTVAVVGGGTVVNVAALGWNVRVPLREFWPEEASVGCSATDTRIVVRLVSTVNDSIAVSGTLYVCEQG